MSDGDQKKLKQCAESACNLPKGVTIIGELAAKFWLLNKTSYTEFKDEIDRVHRNDDASASV